MQNSKQIEDSKTRKQMRINKKNNFLTISFHETGSSDYLNLVRSEATQLVDNVLERSVFFINSQQHSSNTLYSESEHFAITCDPHGADLIKSPTIESMSGKSFDDNLSGPDESNPLNDSLSFNQTLYDQSDLNIQSRN